MSFMDGCIDFCGKSRKLPALDANSGSCQILIDEKVVDKTALVAHNGLYKSTLTYLGLKTALAMSEELERNTD